MPTVAVIGASRGIGLALVRHYAADGWRVHATTRTPDAPGELGRVEGDVVLHELEVCNGAHIVALVEALRDEPLDVLIHNAGVKGSGLDRETVMRINADGPIAIAQALLDNVKRSDLRRIVLMTSQMGARHGSRRSLGTYGDSKAALNDRFRAIEPEWRRDGVIAVVVHPGWVRTDMGGSGAPLSVDESARGIREVVDGLTPEHAGRFWCWDGREHPW